MTDARAGGGSIACARPLLRPHDVYTRVGVLAGLNVCDYLILSFSFSLFVHMQFGGPQPFRKEFAPSRNPSDNLEFDQVTLFSLSKAFCHERAWPKYCFQLDSKSPSNFKAEVDRTLIQECN